MFTFLLHHPSSFAGAVVAIALLAVWPGTARGQAGVIGSRGGQTTPTVAPTPAVPGTPVLPSSLNLPPAATSSLLNGLNASGTALRPGMGWLVSDLTHQGVTGRQLADVIHQLKPYKQQGVLSFPQPAAPTGTPAPQVQPPTGAPPQSGGNGQGQGFEGGDRGPKPGHGQGLPSFGRGHGGGKGKGK